MTANLSCEKRYTLLNRITADLGLSALLDILAGEIESIEAADGYVINMVDAEHQNLVSLKLHFTPVFSHLEGTYNRYKTNLVSDIKSPVAQAFNNRAAVELSEGTESDSEHEYLQKWQMSAFAVLPIQSVNREDGLPVGTVSLVKEHGKFDEEKIRYLRELLSMMYVPLETALHLSHFEEFQARLKSAAQEHARALQFIVEVNNLTSRDKIYELFTAELFKRFGFECIGIFLREQDLLKNVLVTCSDTRYNDIRKKWADYLKTHHYGLHQADGGVSHTFEKNAPLVFADVLPILNLPMAKHDTETLRILRTPRTLVSVPIRYQGSPIGAMTLFTLSKTIEVSNTDLQLLLTLSAFFGAAITNSDNFAMREEQNREIERLNKILQDQVIELAEQASTDKLTGLYNFRIFEQEIEQRISEYKRTTNNEGLSIAVIDIDHFKRFNDTYGHSAGNQVLAGVARTISQLVRKMDKAFRYGGEEFTVMMTRCPLEGAMTFAERIRKAVEETTFDTDAGPLSVTVSIGCATFQISDSQETFFRRADEALYQAKNGGRNQVAG